MNEEDDLLEIELDDEVESESSLPSPRFELDGVLSVEELVFIKDISSKSKDGIPLYIIYGMDKLPCGSLDLKLDTILQLRYIGMSKYYLYLVNGNDSVSILHPGAEDREINQLLNFIRIR